MGVIVNFASIIIGSVLGLLLKKGLPEKISDTVLKGVALCVMLIGFKGMLEGEKTLVVIISIVAGAIIGEVIDIDRRINNLAKRTEERFNKNGGNAKIANGLVTATLLFCVGAMAIVGSLDSGLRGDNTTLYTKSLLDGITAIVFASSLGIGVILSSVPVLLYQGAIVLLASLLSPLLTTSIINEMTCVGSLLIVALSLNMLGICKLKVANYLPAILMPILLCQFM